MRLRNESPSTRKEHAQNAACAAMGESLAVQQVGQPPGRRLQERIAQEKTLESRPKWKSLRW
jgi:hypothetical protein